MRNVLKKLLALAATLLSITAAAQTQTYSLDDCIRLALENNEQVRNSLLDIKSTEFNIQEVKSALLPNANLNGQYQYYTVLPSQYAPASNFGGPEGQYSKLTLNMRQTTSANVQITQNLYNQSVFTGLKAARVAQEAARLQGNVTRESVIYSVTSTYYSIQVLNDNLDRLSDNIENLEKTVKVNQSLVDNELASNNVQNRLKINLENLRNQYENQKLVLEQNITQLKYLMNVQIADSLNIPAFDYNELLAEGDYSDISQRPDILLQQEQVKLSQFDRKSIVAGYYPVLAAGYSYGYTSYYNEFSPMRQINNDWIYNSYFTLSLKVPLFDGFKRRSQVRQKDAAISKNLNTLSMMKAKAEKEVQDANTNYSINKNQLVSNKVSLDLAEKLFSSAQTEYGNGIISLTDLLNSQNDLSSARNNYSTALLNLKLAELSMKKANGTLLSKN